MFEFKILSLKPVKVSDTCKVVFKLSTEMLILFSQYCCFHLLLSLLQLSMGVGVVTLQYQHHNTV